MHYVKLPDVGEGVAEAELIEWRVAIGDVVTTETVLVEVMTDKATVEISSPVSGVVRVLAGDPGDLLAVGSDLVGIELGDDSDVAEGVAPSARETVTKSADTSPPSPRPSEVRSSAAPAVRARATSLGIELAVIDGSGPEGRVLHSDLDRYLGTVAKIAPVPDGTEPRVEPLRGLRRRIADKVTASWTEIPHITYVESIDMTELEALRVELNDGSRPSGQRLTILPFLVRAIVAACLDQPRFSAHYDATDEELTIFEEVHVGIATQTDSGLMVPVVRDAHLRSLWEVASEVSRLAESARAGGLTSSELSGSTITVTSLGSLGGVVTTPIINRPEVAIVGVNKVETRAIWIDGAFVPRQMMNLSSSFDHRIIDGWDAATFIQRIKALLEAPTSDL